MARAHLSIAAPTVSAATDFSSVWDNPGMATQSRWLNIAFIGIALGVGLGSALLWRHYGAAPVTLATGTYVSPSRALPDFSLIDQHGQSFGSANLVGSWTLVFFGYTNCPDFCPTTLSTLATLEKRLRAANALRPRVLFVSVDAKRDTPEQLAKYVPYFDPEFIGLTATNQPAIEELATKLGVGVIITPKADGTYTVDHTTEIFVLNPQGRLTAILTGPFSVDNLQADFQRIVAGPA
jgi:protein SCO1/2